MHALSLIQREIRLQTENRIDQKKIKSSSKEWVT